MSRQFQLNAEPLWKLAGLGLLLLSFSFTGWMLGNAAVAVDHLLDAVVDFVQDNSPLVQSSTHNLFTS